MGGGGGQKMTPPFFWSKITILLGFVILSQKTSSGSPLHGVCMGRSGTSTHALISHLWYVGGFCDLGDPILPTVRGVNGDVVVVYAH